MRKYVKELILFLIAAAAAGMVLLTAMKEEENLYEYDIVFLGDSIIGNSVDAYGVTGVMEQRLGQSVFNGAFGGTCMSFSALDTRESVQSRQWSMVKLAQAIYADDWTSQLASVSYSENYIDAVGQALDYFYDRMNQLSEIDFSKVDILLIEHGTNDYNSGLPLESEDSFDITTYAGALRTTLSLLQEKYPDLRIILVSPIYCEFVYEETVLCYETDFGGGILDDYVEVQKSVAEEYDVEWIDLYHGSGIWSDTIDVYTYDKMHLTYDGIKLIGNLIADYLEEYPSKSVQ